MTIRPKKYSQSRIKSFSWLQRGDHQQPHFRNMSDHQQLCHHEKQQLRHRHRYDLCHEHRQQLQRHDHLLRKNDSFILDRNCETRTLKKHFKRR